MVVANKSHPKGQAPHPKAPAFDDFRRVAARVSTGNQYLLVSKDREVLAFQASATAKRLDAELADNASQLRSGVRSYVVTIAGSQPGPLQGSGIRLLDKSGRAVLEIKSGEVDAAGGAEAKMTRIIDACIALAREDLAFLTKISGQLQSADRIGAADLATLRTIIGKNSYRRCIQET